MFRRVMIEVRSSAGNVAETANADNPLSSIAGLQIDTTFGQVAIPSSTTVLHEAVPLEVEQALEGSGMAAQDPPESYLIRAKIDAAQESSLMAAVADPNNPITGVFADVPIHPLITCIGSAAVGDHHTVESLLCVDRLKQNGMSGEGVMVAIVDTGINLQHLNARGKHPNTNSALSWMPNGQTPFQLPVSHGTMCAFDVCIAAPKCTLLDIGVLLSNVPGGSAMEGLLSDAVKAYSHLRTILRSPQRPKALVVSNSWGMFQPSWDYPVGHPGNYSNNPNHPFNVIVGTLEREGADILFAAGNCGDECPDGRCGGITNAIYGANSHPKVLSVAGVDTQKNRVGYSTKGPGRLAHNKPDISGYTHFSGSGVYPVDGGTSAATPVVAGVIAAVRTKFPYRRLRPLTWPGNMRRIITRTAIDRGAPGYDLQYGWGVVDGCKLATLFHNSLNAIAEPADAPGEDSPMEQGGCNAPASNSPVSNSPVSQEATPSTNVPVSSSMGTGVTTGFMRLSVDSRPGQNIHNLRGLPPGTRAISIWVTEWKDGNQPWAGSAFLSTSSVQLHDNGRQCRFVFHSSWNTSLPVAIQYFYGPA